VLVVDNDDVPRKVVLKALARLFFSPSEPKETSETFFHGASGGLDATNKVSKEVRYDLIIMDYEMPDMDGAKAAKEIRGIERSRGMEPVLIVGFTSTSDDSTQPLLAAQMRAEFMEANVVQFLNKRLDVAQLAEVVTSLGFFPLARRASVTKSPR
jgi:CheY-like chemotaxis protein